MEQIYNWKTKHKEGFTAEEIVDVCEFFNISPQDFTEKLGINTCIIRDGETITYHCDVDIAVRCCLEGREKTFAEWD